MRYKITEKDLYIGEEPNGFHITAEDCLLQNVEPIILERYRMSIGCDHSEILSKLDQLMPTTVVFELQDGTTFRTTEPENMEKVLQYCSTIGKPTDAYEGIITEDKCYRCHRAKK